MVHRDLTVSNIRVDAMRSNDTNDELVRGSSRNRHPMRFVAVLLAAGILGASCGSDSSQSGGAATDTTADTVLVDDIDAIEQDTDEIAEPDAEATDGQPAQPDAEPPQDGSGPPRVGGGPPPGAGGGEELGDDGTLLTTGPQNVGEHGPFSNADFDGDGAVTRTELDQFMDGALEREIGLVAFFDLYDSDGNNSLDSDELATVDPAYAFDGTDANEDGSVSLIEVTDYSNEEGRSYRAIGLGEFFNLVDTDDDDVVSADEIEIAHESGLLARF